MTDWVWVHTTLLPSGEGKTPDIVLNCMENSGVHAVGAWAQAVPSANARRNVAFIFGTTISQAGATNPLPMVSEGMLRTSGYLVGWRRGSVAYSYRSAESGSARVARTAGT